MSDEIPDADVKDLDLKDEEITRALKEAPLYLKKAIVKARPAVKGEQIKTVLADGTKETVNTAGEGDIIITNPGGEQYIMKFEKFASRYEPLEEEGHYRAKGIIRAVSNPTQANIRVMAPWGEEQYGDETCFIASPYDPQLPEVVSDDRYIIGSNEFAATYDPVKPELSQSSQPMGDDEVTEELIEEITPPANS